VTESAVARDRLLEVAERLFSEHGYAAVKLRDVAQAAGLHHSSLYHHAPGGKAQLFGEALEHGLGRHSLALRARMDAARGDLRAQLHAAATWVVANPAGNHTRMLASDLPNLPAETATRLATLAWHGVVGPLAEALHAARDRGEADLDDQDTWMVAGALLSALQGLQTASAAFPGPDPVEQRAQRLVDLLLDGIRAGDPGRG